MNFSHNINWPELGQCGDGDIVHLEIVDSFAYLFKVIVVKVGAGEILGRVEAVFDRQCGFQVNGGEILSAVGKIVAFNTSNIQAIIRRT